MNALGDAPVKAGAAYLDQFVYIALARAALGRDPGLADLRRRLLQSRDDGRARFPLSHVHYMETWTRGAELSRRELATEMARFSGFLTLVPISVALNHEIAAAVCSTFGRPAPAGSFVALGGGGAHAFGRVEEAPDYPRSPEEAFLFELVFLSGSGVARHVPTDGAARFADAETEVSRRLADWKIDAADKRRRIRISAFQEFNREFTAALLIAGVPIEEVGMLGAAGFEALVEAVPSLWVLTELRRIRRANPAQGFKRTDLNDLQALAVAIVYCDVVVADKAWVDAVHRTGLTDRFGTTVCARIDEAAGTILAW